MIEIKKKIQYKFDETGGIFFGALEMSSKRKYDRVCYL